MNNSPRLYATSDIPAGKAITTFYGVYTTRPTDFVHIPGRAWIDCLTSPLTQRPIRLSTVVNSVSYTHGVAAFARALEPLPVAEISAAADTILSVSNENSTPLFATKDDDDPPFDEDTAHFMANSRIVRYDSEYNYSVLDKHIDLDLLKPEHRVSFLQSTRIIKKSEEIIYWACCPPIRGGCIGSSGTSSIDSEQSESCPPSFHCVSPV